MLKHFIYVHICSSSIHFVLCGRDAVKLNETKTAIENIRKGTAILMSSFHDNKDIRH